MTVDGGAGGTADGTGTGPDATPWPERDHASLARELGAERAAREQAALTRVAELVGVVFRLRDEDGCPWDRKQTLDSMAGHLVEEAHEVQDAVAGGDPAQVAEELGDTLMNIALMARIGEQGGRFDLGQVAQGIAEKLVRRHPHVFGTRTAGDPEEALASWNESKALEKGAAPRGVLDGVKDGLPALVAARKLGARAAEVGFDWPAVGGALDKLEEEVAELGQALRAAGADGPPPADAGDGAGTAAGSGTPDLDRVEDELGDVLFAAVNVARMLRLDPELALRRTLRKFRRRFAAVERELGPELSSAGLERMEKAWRRAADAEGGAATDSGPGDAAGG